MADEEVKPGEETLSEAFEKVKRDAAAWVLAEQQLLQAQAKNAVRRLELAAALATGAVLAALAATLTLANMLVDVLTPYLGPVLAGLVVAVALFAAGALLLFWVKSLLPTKIIRGRTISGARVIWSALNEPN